VCSIVKYASKCVCSHVNEVKVCVSCSSVHSELKKRRHRTNLKCDTVNIVLFTHQFLSDCVNSN
jgi:hypothetical protein